MSVVDNPHPRWQQRQHVCKSSIRHDIVHFVRVTRVNGLGEPLVRAIECQHNFSLFRDQLLECISAVKWANLIDLVQGCPS